jgi:two-component system, response regulator PdtaR
LWKVEFVVKVELSGAQTRSSVDPAPPVARTLSNILVVDDDRLVLASIAQTLRGEGYQVSTAGESDEAIRLATSEPLPDLVVLDIRLPGVGGIGVAQYLHEKTAIPFVIFSAFGETDIVEEASRLGALAYLVKPLDPSQMIPAIHAAIERAQEIKKLRESAAKLRGALDERELSAMVVGVLMERFALDREAAFDLLRSQARRERRKVRDLAEELLTSSERMNRLAAVAGGKKEK